MKRWLSLLLAVAVVAAMCVFLIVRRNASEEPQNTEKQTEATQNEKQDDGSLHGLKIRLPEDYRNQESTDTSAVYSNGKYKVLIAYQENAAGDDAMALRDSYKSTLDEVFNSGAYWEVGSGKTEETPYAYSISMDKTQATVSAFYATDSAAWKVEVTNIEESYELDPMIFLIVGWEHCDPEAK